MSNYNYCIILSFLVFCMGLDELIEGEEGNFKSRDNLGGYDFGFLNDMNPDIFEGVVNSEELKDIYKESIKNGMLEINKNGKIIGAFVEVGGEKRPSKLFESLINAGFLPEQVLKIRLQVRTKAFKDWFGDRENIVKPYNRRTSKQATVRLNKMSGEKFHINPDAMMGIILTDTKGYSIFNAMGRTFVLCNVNENVIPFYQSSKGTSGKIKGNWYPFFGYTGNWLIKGDVDENGKMSYSSEIDKITELLNKDFKIPTDFNNKGISESTGIDVKDLGLNMYTVFDRFGKYMQEQNTTDPDALVFFDKDLNKLTNANALFVKEITGIKTEGIEQSHASQYFIKPFIEATETSNISKVVDENGEPLLAYHGSSEFLLINQGSVRKFNEINACFIKGLNPYVQDFDGDYANIERENIISNARKNGHDLVVLKNGLSVAQDVYVVFNPDQIKRI